MDENQIEEPVSLTPPTDPTCTEPSEQDSEPAQVLPVPTIMSTQEPAEQSEDVQQPAPEAPATNERAEVFVLESDGDE